jgi:hypothetical protein
MSDASPPSGWARVKDTVDVASKVATVLLAILAFVVTQDYNRRQEKDRKYREARDSAEHHRQQILQAQADTQQAALREIQTITGLFGGLASHDEKLRKLAVLTIKELTFNVPLATRICLAAASEAECVTAVASVRNNLPAARAEFDRRQATLDTTPTSGVSAGTASLRPRDSVVASTGRRTTGQRVGWVFLGSWATDGWASRYLDFPASAKPASLEGRTLRVRQATGALNVRGNLFYEPGYDRIVDVLPPGTAVTLDSIASFANGGYYIWARARY